MSDTKKFLDEMMPRIHLAETALHNGDAGLRFEQRSERTRKTAQVGVPSPTLAGTGPAAAASRPARLRSRRSIPGPGPDRRATEHRTG